MFNNITVEYSYQHRYGQKLALFASNNTFGADLGIMADDPIEGVRKSFGDNFGHGDDYYAVQLIDMSVFPLYDTNKQLEVDLFYNNPRGVLDKMKTMLNRP